MNSTRIITGISGICILLLLCSSFPVKKKKERKVLFVGNVITNAHGMTATLQKMLDEQHVPVKIRESTQYGLSLAGHTYMVKRGVYWSNAGKGEIPSTIKWIGNGSWEMVVFQESPDYILIPEFEKYGAGPALRYLDSLVKKVNSKTVLFQLYTDARFPKKRCNNDIELLSGNVFVSRSRKQDFGKEYCSGNFVNSAEEFKAIQQVYNRMAAITKAPIVPVGAAYELCKNKHPEIELYDGTESPSKQGSYLIACVFYRYIAKKQLKDVKYCADVNATEAKKLRDIADAVPMK